MSVIKYIFLFVFLFRFGALDAQPGQIGIPRVGLMSDQPAPFNIRDWREVALRYDSFVYDETKTGQYLPLVQVLAAGINYPQQPAFGLHTYVGTHSPQGHEAINILPSLVGATLAGADKTDQFGRNWVRMSQDFFNKNNGQLIYLNSRSGGSGGDWWYDLMPNVFFYQLYDLYPDIGGDAGFQFNSVADRFLASVRALGGSDAPWQKANMDYRAFDFLTMQPNPNGVHEPEAAGAYAWVLYNAYRHTGNPAYLQGAEWSLEFLDEWDINPSYELQLPYGTYTAARMNAELGTNYDVEKMVNWSFDRGPLRGWGTIVGNWGGFDVSGLVGEANDNGNDYAFQLNGLQQAAALAPMVRYDKRFARAIGKWILNLSNATRLFYPAFLPASLQDGAAWSNAHDPQRVVGHEALREVWQGNSPFATGDAVQGGWANTNLSLYSTSAIGYLGGIVEKTNVDKILRIDLLKTDFFGAAAYPTFLYFNPLPQAQNVQLAVGDTPVDVYEALSETFILQNTSGTVTLPIAAGQAIVVTLTPAGGAISYDKNKMLVNGVVVDYRQSAQPFQYAPRIQGLAAAQAIVEFGDSTAVYAKVSDLDSGNFTWTWSATGGSISGSGPNVQWLAPSTPGSFILTLIVADESGQSDTASVTLGAVAEINEAPAIAGIQKSAAYVAPGGSLDLLALASDANDDPLTYAWTASGGSIAGNGPAVSWTAPAAEGIFQFNVTVTDDGGLSAQAGTNVLVKNFSATTGNLIAHYPFSGNANDVSGNQLHGQLSGGALIVNDLWGNAASACRFDGVNDVVNVPNNTLLNFQNAITVSAWFSPAQLPDHEIFLLSHGSWQNRWKISVTPEHRVRWTVNTLSAIGDLDSERLVGLDSAYHIAVSYDGALMALYWNGQLQSYKALGGLIRTASLPFLMGQMLPGNLDFNYKGLLDEVKIFDYALTPDAVQSLYQAALATQAPDPQPFSLDVAPNPARDHVRVRLPQPGGGTAGEWLVYDGRGALVWRSETGGGAELDLYIAGWKPGIYMVIFRSGLAYAVGRFVKA